MKGNKLRWVGAILVAVATMGISVVQAEAPAAFDPSDSDEKAIEIADRVLAALGGSTWEKVHFIKFTYLLMQGETRRQERTHYWDRVKDRYRMEGPSRTHKPVVAVVDHKTGNGKASLDGQLLFDDKAQKFIDIASKSFLDDSLWLLLPFRLKDPGARLRYDGEKLAGPVTYDMITLRLPDTPNAKYRFYINRATNLIDSLAVVPKGANVSPVAFQWVDWEDVDGLKFSLRKTQSGGDVEIVLEGVQVFDSLPEAVFTSAMPLNNSAQAAFGQ